MSAHNNTIACYKLLIMCLRTAYTLKIHLFVFLPSVKKINTTKCS